MRSSKYIALFTLLVAVVMSACTSSTSSTVSPNISSITPDAAAVPSIPVVNPPAVLPANRVEVAYFHMPQRCGTCLCYEERVIYVVNTYFKEQLASGTVTFDVCDLADRSKAALIRKYNAYGSQLFINTVVDNTDHIKNILDIYKWRCERDNEGFDDKVRSVIKQALDNVG